MAKTGVIEQEGIVEKALPNAIFKIKLQNEHLVTGHISGKMRKHFIKIEPGDTVKLEMSPYDLTKGRITYRQNPNNTTSKKYEGKNIRKKT